MADRKGSVESLELSASFWAGRRVLVTGHTGFKGAWLVFWLQQLGAAVTGVALPPSSPSLFESLTPWPSLESHMLDLTDPARIVAVVRNSRPEIVFHLAAQSLVGEGHRNPRRTFSTNVLGTVHLLDALRGSENARAIIIATSDKVYDGAPPPGGFSEEDRLGGKDPYGASKVCAEFVTVAYRECFLSRAGIITIRAGNVIGGGDWAEDRLIPDIVRAWLRSEPVALRYPVATRPWQHVLDAVRGYLLAAQRLATSGSSPPSINLGPPLDFAWPVSRLADEFSRLMGHAGGWRSETGRVYAENYQLSLNSALAERSLGWRPRLTIPAALLWTADWYKAWRAGQDLRSFSLSQIERYAALPAQ